MHMHMRYAVYFPVYFNFVIIFKCIYYFLFPGLYALINNAGVCVCGEFEWQTWSQIEHQVNVNILGTLRVTKAFLPLLKTADTGKYWRLNKDFQSSFF
jgi:NAD(P)-dependent dehydrogenase (short-subunit alcohol dehydrogenase family)